jgi:hypothetical protein
MADPFEQSGLRPDRILSTLEQLQARIAARFPESGLSRVCVTLIDTARWSVVDAGELARPNWLWRVGVAAVVVVGLAAQLWALRLLNFGRLSTLDPPSMVTRTSSPRTRPSCCSGPDRLPRRRNGR